MIVLLVLNKGEVEIDPDLQKSAYLLVPPRGEQQKMGQLFSNQWTGFCGTK